MSQKETNAKDNITTEDNGAKDNTSNIVVKIGGSNNNLIIPMDAIDSSEDTEKTPEKQKQMFSDDSSSSGDKLSNIVCSLKNKEGATIRKQKCTVTRKKSKVKKQNKKTHSKPTTKKRKKSDATKQKSVARTNKVSQSTSTVPPKKRGPGRPRKNKSAESTPTNKSCTTRKDPKQTIDIPLNTPTNLAGQYRFKPRQSISIMAPLKIKRNRLSKLNNASPNNHDSRKQVTGNNGGKKFQSIVLLIQRR